MKVKTEKKFLNPKKDYFSWDYRVHNIDFMSDFDDESAGRFLSQIRAFSKEMANYPEDFDENTDINLYINSRGGIVTSLLAMIDAMSLVPNDFATICIGQCASCGAVLLSAGTKGKRYITENARVLIHQVSSGMWGKNSEIQADAKEADRLNKLLIGMLAKNCGKSVEEIEQLTLGGDLVLDAEQAVEFGIVDAILTKDVIDRLNGIKNAEIMVPDGDNADGEGKQPMEYKNNKDFQNSFLNLEIKSVKDEDNFYYIKGYASTPDVDRVADIVNPDCLIKSVDRMGMPAFIHQHDLSGIPMGVCEKVYMEGNNTAVELKMPKDDLGKTIKARIDIGAYKGLSIGYIAKDYEYTAEGYRLINDLDWYEVSLVTIPANPKAEILEVKNKLQKNTKNKTYDIIGSINTIRDVENLLCELGVSKKEAGYIIKVVKSSQGEPAKEDEGMGEPDEPQEIEENIQAIDFLTGVLNTLNGK